MQTRQAAKEGIGGTEKGSTSEAEAGKKFLLIHNIIRL